MLASGARRRPPKKQVATFDDRVSAHPLQGSGTQPRAVRASTSMSESFAPSMRVEEPMLSIVATRRSEVRRS